jgi:hypothetical protein
VIKYAWKYDDGAYYVWCSSWMFRTTLLEVAQLEDSPDAWKSMKTDGKAVQVEVFAEKKYPWGPTRREINEKAI